MALRLRLLGSPAVEIDRRVLAIPFERRTQLLAFLALKGGWVGRAELAAMLWPDVPAKLAFTNLRKALFRLQSLPWARGLEVQTGAVRFACETDVQAFEAALREKRTADAVASYEGDLLPGYDDEASEAWSLWLNFERERLKSGWRAAVLAQLGSDIDPAEAVDLSARLLHADPLDESTVQAHIACLSRAGQLARAREVYRDFAARLSSELGVAPGAALQALHDSLPAAGTPGRAAAPRVADDGFVGRAVELRQIDALLSDPACRLVSIVGPGGAGKTRLARRAMTELAPRYADGVAFVPLEDAAGCSDVAARLAAEIGAPLAAGRDTVEQVTAFLQRRRMLLVLDNFEHLTSEVSVLERLLLQCPGIDALVTSRVRLGLQAEQLLPLEGLPCPDVEDRERIEAFDAARLFVKTARRMVPGFTAEADADAIVEICRRVEGLPLALELAAAWTRVMPCAAIAAQLREGADLLRAEDASHPPRHASIARVFDQAWHILGPLERDALGRLSVFHGGFTADAARTVAGAALPVVAALVDKSLLRREGARLRMHALVQEFAAGRLAASGGEDASRRAHASHYLRFMAQLRRHVQDGKREALQSMEDELENCRAAWHWAIAHGTPESIARSVPTLLEFCDHRFRFDDGLELLRRAAEGRVAASHPRVAALVAASAAHVLYRLDRYVEAEARALSALESAPADDTATRLQCFKVLGGCCLRLGRLDESRRWFRRALREAPASVDPNSAAAMLDNLALVEKSMGHYEESLRLSHQSLLQHRALDDVAGEALCLNNLGALCLDRGDHESARAHLREGLALCEKHGLLATRALVLANLTELAVKAGDADAAEFHAHRALEIAQATGSRALAAWLKLQTAALAVRRGHLDDARADLAAALEIAIALRRPAYVFGALDTFADLLAAQGERGIASQVLGFIVDHASSPPEYRDSARARLQAFHDVRAAQPPWPGISLDELTHRIVAEAAAAHGPLIAALRAPRSESVDAGAA